MLITIMITIAASLLVYVNRHSTDLVADCSLSPFPSDIIQTVTCMPSTSTRTTSFIPRAADLTPKRGNSVRSSEIFRRSIWAVGVRRWHPRRKFEISIDLTTF